MSEQKQGKIPALYNVSKQQVILTGGALLTSGIVDVATHSGAAVYFGLAAVAGVGYLSKDIIRAVVPGSDAESVVNAAQRVIDTVSPEPVIDPYKDQSPLAKLKRLAGMSTPPIYPVPAQPKDDVMRVVDVSEDEYLAPLPTPQLKKSTRNLIDLAPDLQIEKRDIVGKAIFVCGIRRHGKTTLGARLAEQLGKFYIPMFIPDLEGDYISLADTLPRAIIAGHSVMDKMYLDYDYAPLDTAEEAFQLGYNTLEYGFQVILDMNAYEELDMAVMIQVNVIRGMFKWANDHPEKRVPAYVYLDEAQRFLPQTLNDSVIMNKELVQGLLKAYMDIIAIGGKRGINPVVLTQRFAQVNNKIMAQSEVFFLMRQTHDTDLKRCMEYASDPITKEQISKFDRGEGIYIATDGSQLVTRFHQRESDGSRSTTPQADEAQRYAGMSMMPTRSVKPDAPKTPQRPNLSVVPPVADTPRSFPQALPQTPVNAPTERAEFDSEEGFLAREDDLLLSELQIQLLKVFYQSCSNVNKSLEQIRDEKGRGLGGRYTRHASFILEQAGLKKRRA